MMKKLSAKQKTWLIIGSIALVAFVAFTIVMAMVDVKQIKLNQFIWQHCGKNMVWERVTDWLGYLVILALLAMCVCQVWQWLRRKSLSRVDRNLILFDMILVCLVLVYFFFEIVVVNCRPELVNKVAKASYPSSHAMLFATVLPLLIYQVWYYLGKNQALCFVVTVCLSLALIIGLVGRLLSGVHWFTDILGGVIISCSLVSYYLAFNQKSDKQ